MCVLRNLSYRLENEVDPQEGGEDVLDREWEQEQRRELEDLNRSFSKTSPGCLPFCVRPQPRREPIAPRITLTSVVRPSSGSADFAFPGQLVSPPPTSSLPPPTWLAGLERVHCTVLNHSCQHPPPPF